MAISTERVLGPLTREDMVLLLPALLDNMAEDALREALAEVAPDQRDTLHDILVDLDE